MTIANPLGSLLDGLDPDTRRALQRYDFGAFAAALFNEVNPGVRLIGGDYLDFMCSRLQDVVLGSRRHLIINIPPRSLKSYVASVALPAFFLGHFPSSEVLAVSYGQELARKFGNDTQTLMRSAAYRAVFGDVLPEARQPGNYLRTRAGGNRRGTSIDGAATGLGADIIIFDDPQKAGESFSEAVRRASNEKFETTFLSRRNDPATCRLVIVTQRLHENDFTGHVLDLGGDWEVINLPAIAEHDEAYPYKTFLGDHTFVRSKGEALHAARVPIEELHRTRDRVGEAIWACQFQQRPAPAGGGLVKPEWFRRYALADRPMDFDRMVQSWDTANVIKDDSAFSVCTTWGVKGTDAWLLDVFRKKLIYPDLKRAVIRQAAIHDATVVLIEDQASGIQLLQDLPASGVRGLRAVKSVRDKQTRMLNVTDLIEGGRVHVPEAAPWLEDYLYEFAVFPKGRYWDQVDSTSQALDGMFRYRNWEGLIDFYHPEANRTSSEEDEIYVVKCESLSVGVTNDCDGNIYYRQDDGHFHLPRNFALFLMHTGWPKWIRVR